MTEKIVNLVDRNFILLGMFLESLEKDDGINLGEVSESTQETLQDLIDNSGHMVAEAMFNNQ